VSAAAGVAGVVGQALDQDRRAGIDLGGRFRRRTSRDQHLPGAHQLAGMLAGAGQTSPDQLGIEPT
jgi:hypothetical protein